MTRSAFTDFYQRKPDQTVECAAEELAALKISAASLATMHEHERCLKPHASASSCKDLLESSNSELCCLLSTVSAVTAQLANSYMWPQSFSVIQQHLSLLS